MIDIPTGTYEVQRFGKGEWADDGTYKKGSLKAFDIEASMQPASGNMIKQLPEHRRSAESYTLFLEEKLFISDEASNQAADIVIYDGRKFEVFMVKNWSVTTDIPHYECLIVKEDGQGNGTR